MAKRRVLTVKGRTSATIGMFLVGSEAASTIREVLHMRLPERALRQCKSLSSDDPSRALYSELRTIMPNLEYLSLDPVHLAIVYNNAFWKKSSDGQVWLRRILNKFNKILPGRLPANLPWGPAFHGQAGGTYTAQEEAVRAKVRDGSFPKQQAKRELENMDVNIPFSTKVEFLKAMASLVALHWDEVDRTTAAAPGTWEQGVCPVTFVFFFVRVQMSSSERLEINVSVFMMRPL